MSPKMYSELVIFTYRNLPKYKKLLLHNAASIRKFSFSYKTFETHVFNLFPMLNLRFMYQQKQLFFHSNLIASHRRRCSLIKL